MQVDAEQRLWVIRHVRRENWLDHMEERVAPNGRVGHMPTDDDWRYVFESHIDLIDLTRGSFIATRPHDALFEAFVGDGHAGHREQGDRNRLPSDGGLEVGFRPRHADQMITCHGTARIRSLSQ